MMSAVLERAQSGDGAAFDELISPYRRELHVHCYRILGSVQDAEDALQETLLAAWQGIGRFDGRALRAWLYRIATNRCRNHLRDSSRRPKVATLPGPSAAHTTGSDEPWWLGPYPHVAADDLALGPEARYEARESIALSFVAGLQLLPVHQRAALVLRDVLGFSAAEVAEMLDCTTAAVNSALARARGALPPSRDLDRITLPRSRTDTDVVTRFVDSFQSGDIAGMVELLTDDARLLMPPEPFECHGRHAIANFFRDIGLFAEQVKLVPTSANAQPAFGYYRPDPYAQVYRAAGILVLATADGQITTITRFGEPHLLADFGLPRTLPDDRVAPS